MEANAGAAVAAVAPERPRKTIAEGFALWDLDLRDQAKRARIAAVDVSEPVELETVDDMDWMDEAAEVATEAWGELC